MKGYRAFIHNHQILKQPKGPLTGTLINRQCKLQAMDCYSRGRTSELQESQTHNAEKPDWEGDILYKFYSDKLERKNQTEL